MVDYQFLQVYFILEFCRVLYSISIKTFIDSETANRPITIRKPNTKADNTMINPISAFRPK